MNLPTAEIPCLHGHCTLHRQEIANTILKPLYGDFLRVRGVSVKLLSLCFEEQLQLRMLGQQAQGRDLESLPSDPDPGELRVVQELCKQWLGRAGPKSKKGTPADKMPALRFLHGQLQQHQQQSQRRPTEEGSRVPAGGVTETATATDGMPPLQRLMQTTTHLHRLLQWLQRRQKRTRALNRARVTARLMWKLRRPPRLGRVAKGAKGTCTGTR